MMFNNKNSTDDDARKAMRLDASKLKEIQVRLFLSSRAEMQEVIETARQTTISLMQIQRQPTIAAPSIVSTTAVPPPVLTPQSPPQVNLAAAIHQQKIPPTLSAQLPGLITQQMYHQQIQQLHQQVNRSILISETYIFSIEMILFELKYKCFIEKKKNKTKQNPVNALIGLPPKTGDTLDLVSSRRGRRSRTRSRSRSYSRSRSRSRSPSRSRDRYRRRSRSPRRNKVCILQ